jgi:ubiquinone/menaquinone biosynthesis C-methylase UbiE
MYTYKKGDPNGIGKWYMGRQIAHVMGYQGIDWLERSNREDEENTSTLINNMKIKSTDIIADIGAGSGYHVFKMAATNKDGFVYAVDIQDEMLSAINYRINEEGFHNVKTIKGNIQSANLPSNSVDKVLLVDVYHEFEFPAEMVVSIKKALKPTGKIYLIEYRGEDDWVPIKKVHKMTEAQCVKEMEAAGFRLEKNISNLPWQHCIIFIHK